MSFNKKELVKIRIKTSASSQTKILIAEEIKKVKENLAYAKELASEEALDFLNQLRKKYVLARQEAYSKGATSYANPNWAVPATCESWLTVYLKGSDEEKKLIEKQIDLLQNPNRPEEKSTFNWGRLVILIGAPLAFYFQGWILAIVVVIIGFTISGWKNRYDGPLEVK